MDIVRNNIRQRVETLAKQHGLTFGEAEIRILVDKWLKVRSKLNPDTANIDAVVCRVSSYRMLCNAITQLLGWTPYHRCSTDADASELSEYFSKKQSVKFFTRPREDHVMATLVKFACDFSLVIHDIHRLDEQHALSSIVDDICVTILAFTYAHSRKHARDEQFHKRGTEMMDAFFNDNLTKSRQAVLLLMRRAAVLIPSKRYTRVQVKMKGGDQTDTVTDIFDPALKFAIENVVQKLYDRYEYLVCVRVLQIWCFMATMHELPSTRSSEPVGDRVVRAKIELARKPQENEHIKNAVRLYSKQYTCIRCLAAATAIFGFDARKPETMPRLTTKLIDGALKAQLKRLGLENDPLNPIFAFLDLCRDDLEVLLSLVER